MRSILLLLVSSLLLSACTSKKPRYSGTINSGHQQLDPRQSSDQLADLQNQQIANSALMWVRYRAFEQGLMQGLQLSKEEVCRELDSMSCIDSVHLTALGGNEPYDNGQYEAAELPSVLTPAAVDRVLLSSCSKRMELDESLGQNAAVVFKHLPLGSASVGSSQVEDQVIELYRRLLARDPESAEIKVAQDFAATADMSAATLGVALCFAIGTSVENIFL